MANDGTIKIGTELDQTGFKKGLNGLESSASKGFGGVGKVASAMATATVGALAAVGSAMGAAAVAGLQYNAKMENYMASFTTMLGSESKALAKVEELKKLAASTPYEMADLAEGTKTLMAFGIANKDTTADLTMLGDVSLGNVEKLKSLTIAFGKASSQGKMTGENLQMMIEAGFNPMKIIAETTGESIADLTVRMSKGGISAGEMTAAFKTATSEGGQFYKGMEIASKTTDGLISTLKDNANALVGKIMEPISKSIRDELLPSVINAVEKLTNAFTKDGIPGMIKVVKELVPALAPVIGFFEWVIDNGKTIGTVLGLITAAVVAYKAAVLAQLVVQELSNAAAAVGAIVTGLFTGAKTAEVAVTGSATAAQWLLNAAMAANPAGLIIAAVAALVSGLVIFTLQTSDATKATKALLDESKDLVKSCDDAAAAFADQSAEIDTNAVITKKLSDELYSLAGKENKSNAEKARMVSLVDMLNQQMPDLNLTIDEQTGLLNQNKSSVDALIKSKLAEIRLQANEEELLRLYKEEVELAAKKQKTHEALTKAQAAYDKALADGVFFLNDYGTALINAKEADDLLAGAQTEAESSTRDQEKAVIDLTIAYDKQAEGRGASGREIKDTERDLTVSAEETTAILTADLERRRSRFDQHAEASKAYLDQQKKELDDYNAAFEAAASEHMSQMGGIEDKGIAKTKLTAAEVKRNLEQQIIDFQNWRAGIQAISARVPEDVLQDLRALGPGMDPVIDDLNKMTDSELASWVAVWQGKSALATDTALDEVGTLPGAMQIIGALAGKGFIDGLSGTIGDIKAAAQRANKAAEIGPFRFTGGISSKTGMAAYAMGTNYVPETGVAFLHKGEAVIPADLVRQMQGQSMSRSSSVMSESVALRALRDGGSAKSDSQTGDGGAIGRAIYKALNGAKVEIDGQPAGRILAPYIDDEMGSMSSLKERYA